jgi:hypothetical protein
MTDMGRFWSFGVACRCLLKDHLRLVADVHGPLPEVPFNPERRPRSIYVSLHARARDPAQKLNRPDLWVVYATLPLIRLRSSSPNRRNYSSY